MAFQIARTVSLSDAARQPLRVETRRRSRKRTVIGVERDERCQRKEESDSVNDCLEK
jgi:hypothetical protein